MSSKQPITYEQAQEALGSFYRDTREELRDLVNAHRERIERTESFPSRPQHTRYITTKHELRGRIEAIETLALDLGFSLDEIR